jgi:hypothetical protein
VLDAGHAADEDDPAPGLGERRQRRLHQDHRTVDVGEYHLPPPVRVTVGDGVVGGEAGVGHQVVQPAEPVQRGLHRRLYRRVVGRVAHHQVQRLARVQLGGQALEPGFVPAGRHHLVTGGEQGPDRGRADAGRTAGDQGDCHVGRPSLFG